MSGILAEPELTEISRDVRLRDTGLAICWAHDILDGHVIHQRTHYLLPQNYFPERKAAFEILTEFKTENPEAGAQLNPHAVARAAGYICVFHDSFSNTFFDVQGNNDFYLDVYILRACAKFWESPTTGKPDGCVKRLHYNENDGMTKLAKKLTKELNDRGELVKPSWMTRQGITERKPVLTSMEQLQKLKLLSLVFSSLFKSPSQDIPNLPQTSMELVSDNANSDAEAKLFLSPIVYTPGWKEVVADFLDPHESIEPPHMTSVPRFGCLEFGAHNLDLRMQHYFEYVKKLSAYHSMVLSITLACKLKASVNCEAAFNKWRDAIDECFATGKFSVSQVVWEKFKKWYPSYQPQTEVIEIIDSDDE